MLYYIIALAIAILGPENISVALNSYVQKYKFINAFFSGTWEFSLVTCLNIN